MPEELVVFSPAIKASIADAVKAIPADKRGQITGGATLRGAEVSAAWKVNPNLSLGAYGRKLWGSKEFEAGVMGTFVW